MASVCILGKDTRDRTSFKAMYVDKKPQLADRIRLWVRVAVDTAFDQDQSSESHIRRYPRCRYSLR